MDPSDRKGASLPLPEPGQKAAEAWTDRHLADLCGDDAPASPAFRGGQSAADAALEAYDVRGYASRRNEVWPPERRGASRLSPYIRHGLLPLPRVWAHIAGGPATDVRKFRDELLWQEYARHLYARLGRRTAQSLRRSPQQRADWRRADPWRRDMACVARALEELEASGWLPNQARMWLASQWTVRGGAPWPEGEERFFHHLLDGSRAANRLGWQWTTGAGSSRPYGFSRRQVERRAPGLCTRCALRDACPILDWPEPSPAGAPGAAPAALARDPDPEATGGPSAAERSGSPERVWLTAESLGTDDPALSARPDLPAVFVFDAPLLGRLRLSRKRLVFLVETLAELAQRRALELLRGAPAYALHGRRLAATFTPVPGWRRRRQTLDVVELHPWPWLVRPHSGSVRSFSAWRR